jgi:hypothetical protein
MVLWWDNVVAIFPAAKLKTYWRFIQSTIVFQNGLNFIQIDFSEQAKHIWGRSQILLLLPSTWRSVWSQSPSSTSSATVRVGNKKPTQKNPKKHIKKPPKMFFFGVFFNYKKKISYFFLITCPQAYYLQSKKFNCFLKFCRYYFCPLNTFMRKR